MEDYTEAVEAFNKKEEEIAKILVKSVRELQMLAEKIRRDPSLKREAAIKVNTLKYAAGVLKAPIKYAAPKYGEKTKKGYRGQN